MAVDGRVVFGAQRTEAGGLLAGWGPAPTIPVRLRAAAARRGACEEQCWWAALVPPGFITNKILPLRLPLALCASLTLTTAEFCILIGGTATLLDEEQTRARRAPHTVEGSRDCTSRRALRRGAAILAAGLHFPGGAAAGEAMSAILPLPPPPVRLD